MTTEAPLLLCDPVLMDCGISHGFGQRGSQPPDSTIFSKQVHGADVFDADASPGPAPAPADVLVTTTPGLEVGIVTADCVPILVAARDGSAVAAIHAGWRGLAAGVIEAGLGAIRSRAGGVELVAAVGPAARACCYEVDEPVREALLPSYARILEGALASGRRPGRFQLDLPLLATRILQAQDLRTERIGVRNRVCTICDAARFESHRRDGAAAGRLSHFIRRPERPSRQG